MLNELSIEVHKLAREKGWWDEPRDFGTLIALLHSELSEALEEYRRGNEPSAYYFVNGKPEGIPAEFADVIIRVLDVCGYYDIDIDSFLALKMKYNEQRAYRHGNKVI